MGAGYELGSGAKQGWVKSAGWVLVFIHFFVVPSQEQPVQQRHNSKKEEAEQNDEQNGGKNLLRAKGFGGAGEIDSQTGFPAKPFSNHGAHHTVSCRQP